MKVLAIVATVFALCALPSESIWIGRPSRYDCPNCQPTAAAPPETTTEETTTTPEPTTTEAPTEPPTEPPTTAYEPSFSCEGKPDGVYDLGCSEYFVCCVGGVVQTLRCPDHLKYDSVSGRCLREEHCGACGGVPTEPEPVITAPPTTTTEPPMETEPTAEAPAETEPTTVTAAAPVETTAAATKKCGSKKCRPHIFIGSSY